MENIEVAYQIFYKQCEYSTKETKLNIRRTGTDRITFAPGSTRTLETVTASIRDGRILPITQETTISTPYGSPTFVTGPPTTYLRDRLGGLYLCVSKKDASGKSIEREYMVGNVPEKEDWDTYQALGKATKTKEDRAAYQEHGKASKTVVSRKPPISGSKTPSTVTQDKNPHVKAHSPEETWSEAEIQRRTKVAEGNSGAAVYLGEYYLVHGDMQKAKQWADKARKMLPPGRQESTMKRIEAVDQAIKKAEER